MSAPAVGLIQVHQCSTPYGIRGSAIVSFALLGQGQLEAAKALFADCRRKQVRNFEACLSKHRSRIVNYAFFQAEQLCLIGSGAVESAAKQIAHRLQISGARWNAASVNAMLSLRCANLNGQLAS